MGWRMNIARRLALVCGLVLSVPVLGLLARTPPGAPQAPASAGREDRRWNGSRIAISAAAFPRLMAQAGVQGVQVAVLSGGKTAWHASFGFANAETKAPVTDASIFEAASLSKPVFAYAVLTLVDAGQIDLDTPHLEVLARPVRCGRRHAARPDHAAARPQPPERIPELEIRQRSPEDPLHPRRSIQLLRRGVRVPGRGR